MSQSTPRSVASLDRRALVACLLVGAAAVTMSVLTIAGRLPEPIRLAWDKPHDPLARWFGIPALIIGLDALLVVGSRASRRVADVGVTILFVLLALSVVLFATVAFFEGFWAIGINGDDRYRMMRALVQSLIALGAMAVVQWLCLRAVRARV